MNKHPTDRLLREKQILGCKKTGIPPLVPVSHSTWWLWQRQGKIEPGFALSRRCRVWRESYILGLVEKGVE